jgi:hypothetical protein
MYDPPAGYQDFLADAENNDRGDGPMYPLHVEGVGTIQARKPIPGSAAPLGAAGRSKIPDREKLGYLNLFVRNHIGADQYEQLLERMMTDDAPADTMPRIVEAITTRGTARPTKRSSHSVC